MARGYSAQTSETNDSQLDQRLILLHQVVEEGIRQAKQSADQANWSFFAATIMSTTSAVAGLVAATLLLFGSASEGTVTTAVGLASGMCSYQLSKEAADRQKQANDRLTQLFQKLQDDED